MTAPLKIAVVAGEVSGDELAAALMRAVNARRPVLWHGVGGPAMVAEGLQPIFDMEAVAVNGFDAIVRRLPSLLNRIEEAAAGVVAFAPDLLVIVDAPEFTHRVARRVRRRHRAIPIVNYVSPTVWAWRPGRAKAMRGYVDLVMALFPFEPEAHARLGGPRCVHVGHPLFETMRAAQAPEGEALLVLPGSRRGEIERLMAGFGEAAARAAGERPIHLLAVPHLEPRIRELSARWPRAPRILSGPGAKAEAFGTARAALAASGTVTLELAAARIPMVVAYRLDGIGQVIKAFHPVFPIVKAPSMVLANIILGRNDIPAMLDDEGTPEALSAALSPLLAGGAARDEQASAFGAVAALMAGDAPAAERAADSLLGQLRSGSSANRSGGLT